MQFKAVVFDLDGTLVDSLEDLADAMNRVLETSGLPVHPTAAFRRFIGDGIERLVQRALPAHVRDPSDIGGYVAAMKTEYAKRWTHKTRPYPGIPELIEACAAAGLETAVLTNKPDGPARELVLRLLPGARFAQVMGAGPDLPLKPDPAGALELARRIGVRPGRCLFVGDMAVDMRTAGSSGMYAAGALWGFRSAEELLEAGARLLVPRPADLLPWIRG